MSPAPALVTLDLQAIQSPAYRERGIARYALDFALALQRWHPELIHRVLLRPDLPPAGGIEELIASGAVTTTPDWSAGGGILHCLSPFDLDVPVNRLWPREAAAAGQRLIVTLYDLIPELMADVYLTDPGLRRRYRARKELARGADHLLTLSRAAALDAERLLGVDGGRITVVGGACSDRFSPDPEPAAARRRLEAALPGIGTRPVVYNGAIEPRKNVEGLLESFAALPDSLRRSLQLVLVCRLAPLERNHLEVRAAQLGVSEEVFLTGEVTDEVLVDLYRTAELAVVPSLAEGYGLPAAEAMACGCPVLASGGTALAELVHPEATFDPRDPSAITAAMAAALTDPELRRRLREWSARPRPSWRDVADRAAAAYESVARRGRAAWPSRPRVAFLTPWPPAPTGVADYSARLVPELTRHVDVDVYVDGDGAGPGDPGPKADLLGPVGAARGGYDAVVACLGNSEFHAGALLALRRDDPSARVPPVTLAHEVRFTELYRHAEPRGAVPEGCGAAARAMYPGMPDDWLEGGWIGPDVAARHGVLMAREVIHRSLRFLVTSAFAASLARADADPLDYDCIEVCEYAYPPCVARAVPQGPPIVASFGIVNSLKLPVLLVDALPTLLAAHPDATLVFVGPVGPSERRQIEEAADRLRVPGRVLMTGRLEPDEYGRWLARATIAVQLRATSNGEVSGAVADCITHGIPTIASAVGPTAFLPDFVRKVPAGVAAEDLGAEMASALADDGWLAGAPAAGLRYAGERTFAGAAERLVELLGLPARSPA